MHNEPLWKQHKQKVKQLSEWLEQQKLSVDDSTLTNAIDFLWDETSVYYIRLPDITVKDQSIKMYWRLPQDASFLSVTFMPDNKWNVQLECNETTLLEEGPEPSFWMDWDDEEKHPKTPHFYLNDEFIKHIQLPQPWSQEYEPMLPFMKIAWATGFWDGPLSGYCYRTNNDLYYFDCVEELSYSPKTRMYAVYELSAEELVSAWFRRAQWQATTHSKFKWSLFMIQFTLKSWFKDWFVEIGGNSKKMDKWKQKHKLIGYFEG